MRILYFNDYAMDLALREWRAGHLPGHHLYGVNELSEAEFHVDVLPYHGYRKLKARTKRRVGDLDQQLRALTWPRVDVVYVGCQYDTTALALLRRLRLGRPVVATVHHRLRGPLRHPWLFRLVYGGHDLLLCLTEAGRRHLVDELGMSPDKVRWQGWSADLAYYDRFLSTPEDPTSRSVIAAGKSKRDYDTLVRAVTGEDIDVRIFCSKRSAPSVAAPNVHVEYGGRDPSQAAALDADALMPLYRQSTAVAIPLSADTVGTSTGLTSLVEALALAKPVVMTNTRWLDVDIEREGVGYWVDPGDVTGWRDALAAIVADPENARRMGERGRALCAERFSPNAHGERLAAHLRSVARRR